MRAKGGIRPPFWLALLLGVPVCAGALVSFLVGEPVKHASVVASQLEDTERSYRRPLAHDPETLDPARITDVYSRSVANQIFDGLVYFDATVNVGPALAEFWRSSRDNLTWTFNLRKNVKFHHGRELVADDVVFSLIRLLDPKTGSSVSELFMNVRGAREFADGKAKTVSGLVALDRHTVRISLNAVHSAFVSLLAVGQAKILPRDIVEARGDAFGVQPIGTGPFRFLRWDRGKELVLTANPTYFQAPPKLSRLVFRIFPGDQRYAMDDEFRRSNLEDAPIPPGADRARLAKDPAHVYVKRPMNSVRFYGFNTRIKPLNDRRVRQAIIHAIDREAIIQDVYPGQYVLANGVIPPTMLGYNRALTGYSYDPARARELLAQAGYPGGRGLGPLVIWSSVKRDDILREHELIRKSLTTVGVPVEIRYLTDWPTFSKMIDEGKLPIFLYAWYADVPDPDNFLGWLFHSRGPRNFFGYRNAEVDRLLMGARTAGDVQLRVDQYRKAEQLILEDAPIVPIFHHTYERLFQTYVRNVEVSGLGDAYIPFRKIWLERAR